MVAVGKPGVTRIRRILADNLIRRIENRYKEKKSLSAQILELQSESRVGKSTIWRAVDPARYPDSDITIGKLAEIAKALRCETFELLIPAEN